MTRRSSLPPVALAFLLALSPYGCASEAQHDHRRLFEESLLEQLRSGADSEKVQAAIALADPPPSPRVIGRLKTALADSGPKVRLAAAQSLLRQRLSGLDRTRVRAIVMPALRDADPDVRASAIRALAGDAWPDSENVALVERSVRDPEVAVRATAAQGLATLGWIGRPAIPALERATHDTSAYVRNEAQAALRVLRRWGPP